jgi:PAS domain S-box-containing protein
VKKRAPRKKSAGHSRRTSVAPATTNLLLEQLTAISDSLAKSLDIGRVLHDLLSLCARATASDHGVAYLIEPDGRFTVQAQRGFSAQAEGALAAVFGQGEWLRRVVEGGEPMVVSRASTGGARDTEWLEEARLQSFLVVPLVLGKDRLGALGLGASRRDLRGKEKLFDAPARLYLGQATALARMIGLSAASEQRFRELVQDLDAIVWEADPATFQFTFVSRRAEEILGYPVERWLTEPDFWVEHVDEEDRKRALAYCRKATAEGRDHEFEYRAIAADGRRVWLRDTVRVLRDEHGTVRQLRGLMVDISERRQAERALEERTTYLTSLIQNSPLAIVVLDSEHRVRMINPAFERLFQYSEAEILGSQLDDLIAPKGKREEAAGYTRQILGGEAIHATTRRRRKDGLLLDVEVHGVPLLADGRLIGVYGIYRDVTDRRRAERLQAAVYGIAEAADRSQTLSELYAAVHRIIPDVMPAENFYIALYDPKADMLSFPYFVDAHDLPPAPKKPGRGLTEYVLRTGRTLLCSTSLHEQLERHGEVELIGTPSPIWLGVPLRVGERTIGVMVVQHYSDPAAYAQREEHMLEYVSSQVAQAIERKRVEEELRRSEEKFSKIFRSTPDAISITTLAEGRYLDVNNSFLQMSGYTREEVIGRTALELKLWADPQDRDRLVSTLKAQGRAHEQEFHFRLKSGEVRLGMLSAEIIELAGEACLLAVIRDVTERRTLEQQLRQAQKMEAVGRLAGGVAHDFNNLLMVIRGHSELLRLRLAQDEALRHHAEEIDKAAGRAAGLTQQLLAFSRKQMVQPRVLNLNAVVTDTEGMLRRLIGEDIELVTRTEPALGHVKADPGQIEQIIVNLAVNARDAMPRGGKLIVETENTELDSVFVSQHPGARPGRYVMLAVSDSGVGMSAETQAHIFEPFFTTKEMGHGTGLGLATVYGIVKQSDGYISVYSEAGRGTTFKVYLPRVDEEAAPAARPAKKGEAVARGTETILLVEDEDPVRMLAREFLESKGYQVLEAATGSEALRISAAHAGPIHLLMTDVVMPGMGGRELAEQLILQRPQTRVIYMSGYTDDAIVQHGVLDPGMIFLAKPFTLETLARKLREVLGVASVEQAEKPTI